VAAYTVHHRLIGKRVVDFLFLLNYQGQRGRAFIGLSIRAKMIGGRHPFLRDNLAYTDPPTCKTPIFNQFSLAEYQPNT